MRPILVEFIELLQSFALLRPLRVGTWSACTLLHVRAVRYQQHLKPVVWKRPIVWKLNVDGSSKGNPGCSGGGCVMRNL